MHDQPCPLDMAQKFMAKPHTLRRALDQTGDIGDHKAFGVLQIYHTQIGIQRGKVVIGDLWTCVRHP